MIYYLLGGSVLGYDGVRELHKSGHAKAGLAFLADCPVLQVRPDVPSAVANARANGGVIDFRLAFKAVSHLAHVYSWRELRRWETLSAVKAVNFTLLVFEKGQSSSFVLEKGKSFNFVSEKGHFFGFVFKFPVRLAGVTCIPINICLGVIEMAL